MSTQQTDTLRIPGLHLIADLHGCDPAFLCDLEGLQRVCASWVEKVGLTAVGRCFHQFGDGGGVTGVVVLAESHLSVHTWPEADYVTLDVYVCNYSGDNREKAERLFDGVSGVFSPQSRRIQRIERG